MWVNMRPHTTQLYNRIAVPYMIGISGRENWIDQKRKMILVRPGVKTMIKVLPRIVETTSEFDNLRRKERQCKLSHETEGLESLTKYTRIGCEMECAMKRAMAVCKCIPWFYPNNFLKWPICDMFGGYCYDRIMSFDESYWSCKQQCRKDCHEIEYIIFENVLPMDFKKMCHESSFQHKQLKHNIQQHFAFHNYKTLVQNESIPDLETSYKNGSLCQDYLQRYVGFVNVYSPASYVILTNRDQAVVFYDKLGTVGGTFGLFIGMSLLSFGEVAIFLITIVYEIWLIFRYPDTSWKNWKEFVGLSYGERIIRNQNKVDVSVRIHNYKRLCNLHQRKYELVNIFYCRF